MKATAQLHAGFTSNVTQGCSPLIVSFKDTSSGNPAQWLWDLGNGALSIEQNPSAVYLNPGTYTIKLYIKSGSDIDSAVLTDYITVFEDPVVAFGADITEGCSPLGVQFTDSSIAGSGNIINWSWDFGDGITSPVQNPFHTYGLANNFNVSLAVTNSYGCKRTLQKPSFIKVLQSPEPAFTYTYDNICKAPATIVFENTTTFDLGTSYEWLFGDNTGSNQKNPVHVYLVPGIYTVQLKATRGNGCSNIYTQTISIGEANADFEISGFCLNTPVTFTDKSTPTPLKVIWDFGDGTTDSGLTVAHLYQAAGPYQVTLTAYFGDCIDVKKKTITAGTKPLANFDAPGPKTSCIAPFTVKFKNASANAVSYRWLFGDGLESTDANPDHTYTGFGKYNVTLIVYSITGCADTLIKKDLVQIGHPEIRSIGKTPYEGCAPRPVQFAPVIEFGGPIVSYKWDFGDGSSSTDSVPLHVYTNPGVYDVWLRVITSEGCTDSLLVPGAVLVGKAPVPYFSATPLNTCAENPVQFTDSTIGDVTTRVWIFGDGTRSEDINPSHNYKDTGYFDVTLIVGQYGCYDTLTKINYVYIKPPIAKFGTTFKCADPYTYYFTDKSIGAKKWSWNFGDGVTANGANQTHTYATTGAFPVSLTVINGSCVYVAHDTVRVIDEDPTFQYEFLNPNACKYDSVRFTATEYDSANILSFKWDFGDGDITGFLFSNVAYHAYKDAGIFSPLLIAKDINNCIDTINKNIQVQVYGPEAAFSNKEGDCIFSTIDFIDGSVTDGVHPITTWIWDYGDGVTIDTLTAPPFKHRYNADGTYYVSLKVIDNNGCYDSTIGPALYIADPVADFEADDTLICTNSPVSFKNLSRGISLTYNWNFGDGESSTGFEPVHSYNNTGIYNVSLALTDKYGCTDSVLKLQYIRIADPKADFTLNDTLFSCPPGKIAPVNNSINYESLLWEFGDGDISEEINPEHLYTQAGTYTLKLTVSGYGNCYDTLTKKIVLKGPSAQLHYSPDKGCDSLHVSFTAQAQNTVSYIWDFGNGIIQQTNTGNISYTYPVPGQYVPKLIITDSFGCNVPIVIDDTIVIADVEAAFTASRVPGICDSSLYSFIDVSDVQFDKISSYEWFFGDGDVSTEPNPQHYYNNTGLYNASFKVTTIYGCQDVYQLPVNALIDSTPTIFATIPDSVCSNKTFTATAGVMNNSPQNFTWAWDMGDGTSESDNTISHSFGIPTIYQILVSGTSAAGCSDTLQHSITVNPSPQTYAGADTVICSEQTITLSATGATSYNWLTDATLSCITCVSPVASPLNNTTYYVTGTNSYGCTASDSITVVVKQPANVSIDAPDTVCMGTTIYLRATGAEVYRWEPASEVSNSSDSVTSSTPSSSLTYTMIGTDTKNCFTDTASVFVNVFPIPSIQIHDSATTIPVGSSYQMNITGSADITTWLWNPAENISCTNCINPVVSPKQTTTYVVQGSNAAGCITQESITIHVSCTNQDNLFIPNTFSPNADGMNDYFYPRGKGLMNIKSLRIFNRWGSIVYQRFNFPANQQSYGWDGTYNGKSLQTDVYVFVVEITCESGQIISSKGNVTLLR